jgi:hypothetical protein
MKKSGCSAFIALLAVAWVWNQVSSSPAATAIAVVVFVALLLGGILFYKSGEKTKAEKDAKTRDALAEKLENLAQSLPYQGPFGASLAKDEIPVYQISGVTLIEPRSSGGQWVGGNQGFSFRIAKGISYRVGASRGEYVKNPEQLQRIDVGTASFTNKRVTFTGELASREWRFDKILNVDVTGNGAQVMLSVSNRQKPSGLLTTNFSDISPGMAIAIANDWYEGGKDAAVARCKALAAGFKAISQGLSEAEATTLANPALQKPTEQEAPPPASAPKPAKPATSGSNELYLESGDEVDVVGESFNAVNFESVRTALDASFGETQAVVVDLVAEPFNKYSKNGHAVAIQYAGLTLGHIAETENTQFFNLLKEFNGRGKCDAEIYFAPEEPLMKNSVRLFCVTPPRNRFESH